MGLKEVIAAGTAVLVVKSNQILLNTRTDYSTFFLELKQQAKIHRNVTLETVCLFFVAGRLVLISRYFSVKNKSPYSNS
jgi:hypothetical protein